MATQYVDNIAKPESHPFGIATPTVVRTISLSDLSEALRLGWEDFKAVPSHAIILCMMYPVLGLLLFRLVLGYSVLPLLFPLAAGFALIGPFAALGLYELSRRRERGEEAAAWLRCMYCAPRRLAPCLRLAYYSSSCSGSGSPLPTPFTLRSSATHRLQESPISQRAS
jgi:hypothetical protein